jgi:hypothetical protein
MMDINNYMNCQNIVSFEKMIDDFSQIKPKNIPIVDIYTLKIMGNYAYMLENYEKWQVCPNLTSELFVCLNDKYPNFNFTLDEFNKLISDNKNTSPSSLDLKIYDFLDIKYKSVNFLNNNESIQQYLHFRRNNYSIVREIISKYKIDWNEISQKYKILETIIEKNFGDLENDDTFNLVIENIDQIEKNANAKIESLIGSYASIGKELYPELIKNKTVIESITILETLKKNMYQQFDKEMDEIYKKEIKTQHYSDDISEFILNLFKVGKSMHLLSIGMEFASIQLKESFMKL